MERKKKKKERGKRVNSYFECPRGVFRFFGQITSIQAVIFERRNGATWLKGRTTGVKNKAAHYTQAVHDEYSLRSNESRCSNAGCRKIAALKRGKRRPTEKTRKTANVTCRIPMNFTSTMQLFFSFPLSFSFFFYFNEDQTWLRLLRVSKNVVSDTFFFLSVDSLNVTTVLHATSKKRCRIHYIRKYYFRRKRIKENIENQKTEFRLWEESFEINV